MSVSPLSPASHIDFSTCRLAAKASAASVEDTFESPGISPVHGGGRACTDTGFLYVLRSWVKGTIVRALTGLCAAWRYVCQYVGKVISQDLTPEEQRFTAMPREHQTPAAAGATDRHRGTTDIVVFGGPPQNAVYPASYETVTLDNATAGLLPPKHPGRAATAPSTTAANSCDKAPQVLSCGPLATAVGAFFTVAVRGVERFREMHAANHDVTGLVENLQSYRETSFTRRSVFRPEQRSVQQGITHYWRHANGDLIEWTDAAAHLELPVIRAAAAMLRRVCTSGLTQPGVLAEIRWFVEDFILQPAKPFDAGEDGIRAARKLIKARKLAVHPDKFEAQAPYAHPGCFVKVRALLDLVDAVRECIDDPVLAPLVMNVTRESEDSVR